MRLGLSVGQGYYKPKCVSVKQFSLVIYKVVEAETFLYVESNTGYIVSARYNESSAGVNKSYACRLMMLNGYLGELIFSRDSKSYTRA